MLGVIPWSIFSVHSSTVGICRLGCTPAGEAFAPGRFAVIWTGKAAGDVFVPTEGLMFRVVPMGLPSQHDPM